MRIIAGAWRGRTIAAPRSQATRPTAERVRQAMFDMLSHAPWAQPWAECSVLDAFAGSGALGLEALSRGAARATFFETDRAAMACLRANITTVGASGTATALAHDAVRPPRAVAGQGACNLVFLDPPYGKQLVARTLSALLQAGWIASSALIVAETAREEAAPADPAALLAERSHGAATLWVWRIGECFT